MISRSKLNVGKLLICLQLVTLVGCTSNPLDEKGITLRNRTVSGYVELENHSSEGVFVWLEGFNIKTTTDQDGKFELILPLEIQSDVSGVFDIYFFVANYELRTVQVVVQNGKFVNSSGALNANGELIRKVFLPHLLAVNTQVSPEFVLAPGTDQDIISISVHLEAHSDTVRVIFPNTTAGLLGSVFFRNIDTEELFLFQGIPVNTDEAVTIGHLPIVRNLIFSFARINLPIGKYQVIPHIIVRRAEISEELINSIALNVEAFGPNYLKMPFKRKDGQLEVR